MPYTKGGPYTVGGNFTNANANNIETQYDEATKSYPQNHLTPFVFSGLVATKNGSIASQLDVTAGVAMARQTDNTLRTWTPTSSSQSTSGHPSTTMWLFLNPDGTFAWQTSSTPPTNALGIAHCTTDGSSNILVVTDDRVTITNILSGAASPPNLPANATAGGSKIWTQANDGVGSGLDADLLDGQNGAFYLAASSYTAADVLTKIKTVDGSGSGLDADLLDGHDSTFFAPAGNYVNKAGDDMTGNLTNSARIFSNVFGSLPAANGGTHAYIGLVDNNAAKLAQIGAIPTHGAGDMAIAGTTYWTTQGSAGFNNSASFSSFDVAEIYATDQHYDNGTLLCPQEDGAGGVLMRRCTHDGCHAALPVSKAPGFGIGGAAFTNEEGEEGEVLAERADEEMREHLALCGRVRVVASGAVALRELVTADGAGGVRAMRPGEAGYTLGYALHAAQDGAVGIVVRPMYCHAPGAAVKAPKAKRRRRVE